MRTLRTYHDYEGIGIVEPLFGEEPSHVPVLNHDDHARSCFHKQRDEAAWFGLRLGALGELLELRGLIALCPSADTRSKLKLNDQSLGNDHLATTVRDYSN